ncbi:hypothetical protein I5Q34_04975 [Streptomyces sp. AV19]|uniref:hypothetical protein n=1 Tax=Streptomyces sp. AV19 TaxID=2793068 RepID=UPI0018FE7707|nr:hypothetical protein [Streptomyces sp. AV19]MBH1933652.1 hypothetical protein [Streptomyces sp. AV19]MDG4535841.1 hypothetical protein [Streptomyces sp. AV19]
MRESSFLSRWLQRVRSGLEKHTPPPTAPAQPIAEPPPGNEEVHVWISAHGINLVPRSAPRCICPPSPGDFVIGTRTGRLGQVMADDGPRLQLRPPRGGLEWDAERNVVRPATDAERLSAKVQIANSASRWGA